MSAACPTFALRCKTLLSLMSNLQSCNPRRQSAASLVSFFVSILKVNNRFVHPFILISLFQILPDFYSSRATFLTQRKGVYEISILLRTNRPTDLCSWKNLPGRTSNGYISITVLDRRMVTMDHP